MMKTIKRIFMKVLVPMMAVIATGAGLLSVVSNQPALRLINGPTRFLLTIDNYLSRSFLFDVMKNEMENFPERLNSDTIEKEGIVSILHGVINEETSILFDKFVVNSLDGQTAQILLAVYTAEGDPIYMNVLFERDQYFLVIDRSHDRFHAEGDSYTYFHFDYLKILTDPETENKFVILTDNNGLTFEQLRAAQIGSDMEGINSFQLFSYTASDHPVASNAMKK